MQHHRLVAKQLAGGIDRIVNQRPQLDILNAQAT
jgi:hypothetical protein